MLRIASVPRIPSSTSPLFVIVLLIILNHDISCARIGNGTDVEEGEKLIHLRNDVIDLAFSKADYSLQELRNMATGYVLVHKSPSKGRKLWEIELIDSKNKVVTVSSADAGIRMDRRESAGDKEVLEFKWQKMTLGEGKGEIDVTVVVTLGKAGDMSEWRMALSNSSTAYGTWRVYFPVIEGVAGASNKGEDLRFALPFCTGWLFSGIDDLPYQDIRWEYPSYNYTMQFCSIYSGESGFYFGCHDGSASHKIFRFTKAPDGMGVAYSVGIYPPDMMAPGKDYDFRFPMVIGSYRGDWYEAAKCYRKWALQQIWCSKGRIADRDDLPTWYKDLALWYKDLGDPQEVGKRAIDFHDSVNLPIAFHWYGWHTNPMDKDYPNYLPPKPGFGDIVAELEKKDVRVFPYLNARLWDTATESWKEGTSGAAKWRDMSVYLEKYASGADLAPMCPYSEVWQTTLQNLSRALLDDYDVDGLYLDQIGAANPKLCFDRAHGHPPGGGSLWADGYRELLRRIKSSGGAYKPVVLVTENNAEPWLDLIDGYLTYIPPLGNTIPLFQAVYSGYAVGFGKRVVMEDLENPVLFRAKQAELFSDGGVPGWVEKMILFDKYSDQLAFLRRLADERKRLSKYLMKGQLVKPVKIIGNVDTITAQVKWFGRDWSINIPALRSSVWKAQDGTIAIVMINVLDKDLTVQYEMDLTDYFNKNDLDLHRLLIEGTASTKTTRDGHFLAATETVPALDIDAIFVWLEN